MVSRILLLVSLMVVFLMPTATYGMAPADVCFWKRQKCCYVWNRCGSVPHRTEHKYDCPYKKCKTICFNICHDIHGHRKCKKICKPKPHCFLVYATCVMYKHYEYAKYCPKLTCEKPKVTKGSDKEPKVFVSPDGKFVKKEGGTH